MKSRHSGSYTMTIIRLLTKIAGCDRWNCTHVCTQARDDACNSIVMSAGRYKPGAETLCPSLGYWQMCGYAQTQG